MSAGLAILLCLMRFVIPSKKKIRSSRFMFSKPVLICIYISHDKENLYNNRGNDKFTELRFDLLALI
ncbi:hypothetical protein ES288_A04G175000v1 [Gossypium darwinii]|uniref:Uncharacterized protein n=1 Tax=Gossypium darwinii TaxID=34276 RepID=A0A5D2GYD6_GOSDA|nr:hypothetical protein ES288_A04G175000v1 [Gossypium darwinii]